MITNGMWQMLSDLLDGEKLPDSLNKAIHDLCNGKAVVAYELTDEEIRKSVMECLEESVADLPKKDREEAKAAILGAFSKEMFYGKTKAPATDFFRESKDE